MVHSASLEPDEEPYCEKCSNVERYCVCTVGYLEEKEEN